MKHVICFHNPEEENGYLGNWYPSPFEKDGVSFVHMEQYMMYRKALQFQDTETAQQILPSGVQSGSRSSTRDCWKNSGKTSHFCKNCWQQRPICWQSVRYTTGSGASDCP